ncbi:MAG: murein L,D-transpeptidase family protein [Pseudomonadota bacterium]
MPLFAHALRFVALATALLLAACQGVLDLDERENAPVPKALLGKMKAKNMAASAPIMLRIHKADSELEVWKQTRSGRYALLETYEICKWSGKLGPKFKEGDRQAPEGFYSVTPAQMNPRSSYHLAFNMGFPNAYDRAHDRTGTHLMVHGACSSAGCYSMTDEKIQEIYALAREAFAGGQKAFQIQAYPFKMTPQNMVKHREHQHFAYWQMLKRGNDHFELTGRPPRVNVCGRRYVFNTTTDGTYRSREDCPPLTMSPSLAKRFVTKQQNDRKVFARWLTPSQKKALPPVTFASVMNGINATPPKPAIVDPVKTPVEPAVQPVEAATAVADETALTPAEPIVTN